MRGLAVLAATLLGRRTTGAAERRGSLVAFYATIVHCKRLCRLSGQALDCVGWCRSLDSRLLQGAALADAERGGRSVWGGNCACDPIARGQKRIGAGCPVYRQAGTAKRTPKMTFPGAYGNEAPRSRGASFSTVPSHCHHGVARNPWRFPAVSK